MTEEEWEDWETRRARKQEELEAAMREALETEGVLPSASHLEALRAEVLKYHRWTCRTVMLTLAWSLTFGLVSLWLAFQPARPWWHYIIQWSGALIHAALVALVLSKWRHGDYDLDMPDRPQA